MSSRCDPDVQNSQEDVESTKESGDNALERRSLNEFEHFSRQLAVRANDPKIRAGDAEFAKWVAERSPAENTGAASCLQLDGAEGTRRLAANELRDLIAQTRRGVDDTGRIIGSHIVGGRPKLETDDVITVKVETPTAIAPNSNGGNSVSGESAHTPEGGAGLAEARLARITFAQRFRAWFRRSLA